MKKSIRIHDKNNIKNLLKYIKEITNNYNALLIHMSNGYILSVLNNYPLSFEVFNNDFICIASINYVDLMNSIKNNVLELNLKNNEIFKSKIDLMILK